MASVSASEAVFAKLETQRLAALKAFWLASVICVLLLPLAVLPLAGSMFVMVDHPSGSAMAAVAEPARELLEPYVQPVMLRASVWIFVG